MPVPPDFKAAFLADLTEMLPAMIDKAWAAHQGAPKATAPRRRPASRVARGRARTVILAAIKSDDRGVTRAEIRKIASGYLGAPVSENTLKRVLMIARTKGEIETKNSRWYEVRARAAPPVYRVKGKNGDWSEEQPPL